MPVWRKEVNPPVLPHGICAYCLYSLHRRSVSHSYSLSEVVYTVNGAIPYYILDVNVIAYESLYVVVNVYYTN